MRHSHTWYVFSPITLAEIASPSGLPRLQVSPPLEWSSRRGGWREAEPYAVGAVGGAGGRGLQVPRLGAAQGVGGVGLLAGGEDAGGPQELLVPVPEAQVQEAREEREAGEAGQRLQPQPAHFPGAQVQVQPPIPALE